MHPDQSRWDEKHRTRLQSDAEIQPHTWVEDHVANFPESRIVDLACGISPHLGLVQDLMGEHDEKLRTDVDTEALDYVCMDVSPVALKSLGQSDDRPQRLRLHTLQTDLEETFPLKSGTVALWFVTFFYSPWLYQTVSRQAGCASRVVAETYCANEEPPIRAEYCLEPGELRDYFSDWDIQFYSENGPDHPETARLVAKK